MTIVERLKSTLGFGDDQAELEFGYECTVCYATFQSTERDPKLVGCPACGSNKVRMK